MGSVTIEVRGAVAMLIMDNSSHMNAIDAGIAEGLASAAGELGQRADIGALVLRGAGDRAFCAGVDLKFVEQFEERAQGFAVIAESVERFERQMASMPIPTIAMLHGNCFGGGVHLAAMTDFRFADSVLKLGIPAVKARLFYPISALERLTHLIGETRTKRLSPIAHRRFWNGDFWTVSARRMSSRAGPWSTQRCLRNGHGTWWRSIRKSSARCDAATRSQPGSCVHGPRRRRKIQAGR